MTLRAQASFKIYWRLTPTISTHSKKKVQHIQENTSNISTANKIESFLQKHIRWERDEIFTIDDNGGIFVEVDSAQNTIKINYKNKYGQDVEKKCTFKGLGKGKGKIRDTGDDTKDDTKSKTKDKTEDDTKQEESSQPSTSAESEHETNKDFYIYVVMKDVYNRMRELKQKEFNKKKYQQQQFLEHETLQNRVDHEKNMKTIFAYAAYLQDIADIETSAAPSTKPKLNTKPKPKSDSNSDNDNPKPKPKPKSNQEHKHDQNHILKPNWEREYQEQEPKYKYNQELKLAKHTSENSSKTIIDTLKEQKTSSGGLFGSLNST